MCSETRWGRPPFSLPYGSHRKVRSVPSLHCLLILFCHSRDWLLLNYRCVRWWTQNELAVWPAEWGESRALFVIEQYQCLIFPKPAKYKKMRRLKSRLTAMKALRCFVFMYTVTSIPPLAAGEFQKREAIFLPWQKMCPFIYKFCPLPQKIRPRRIFYVSFTKNWPAELGCLKGLGPFSCRWKT